MEAEVGAFVHGVIGDVVHAGLVGRGMTLPPGGEAIAEIVGALAYPGTDRFFVDEDGPVLLSHRWRRKDWRHDEARQQHPDPQSRFGSSSHVVLAFSSGPAHGTVGSVWTPPPRQKGDPRQLSPLSE